MLMRRSEEGGSYEESDKTKQPSRGWETRPGVTAGSAYAESLDETVHYLLSLDDSQAALVMIRKFGL